MDGVTIAGDGGTCDICLQPYFKTASDSSAERHASCLWSYLGLDGGEIDAAFCPKCDLLIQAFAEHHKSLKWCKRNVESCLETLRNVIKTSRKDYAGDDDTTARGKSALCRDQLVENYILKLCESLAASVSGQLKSCLKKRVSFDLSQSDTGFESGSELSPLAPRMTEKEEKQTETTETSLSSELVHDPVSLDENSAAETCVIEGGVEAKNKDDEEGGCLKKEDPANADQHYLVPMGYQKQKNGQTKLFHFCYRCNDTVDDADSHRRLHETPPTVKLPAYIARHEKQNSEGKSHFNYHCTVCNTDLTWYNMDNHIKLHRGGKVQKSENLPETASPSSSPKLKRRRCLPAYLKWVGKGVKFGFMQNLYKCTICNMIVPNSGIVMHKRKHGVGRIPCEFCEMSFYSNNLLLAHVSKYHKQEASGEEVSKSDNSSQDAPPPSSSSSAEDSDSIVPLVDLKVKPTRKRGRPSATLPPKGTTYYDCEFCQKRFTEPHLYHAHKGREHYPIFKLKVDAGPKSEAREDKLQVSDVDDAAGAKVFRDCLSNYISKLKGADGRIQCGYCSMSYASYDHYICHEFRDHPESFFVKFGDSQRETFGAALKLTMDKLEEKNTGSWINGLFECGFCLWSSRYKQSWFIHLAKTHQKEMGVMLEDFQRGLE